MFQYRSASIVSLQPMTPCQGNALRIRERCQLKKKMADGNLPYREAKAIVDNPNSFANVTTFNRFSLLENIEDFPALQSRPRVQLNKINNRSHTQVKTITASQSTVPKKRPRIMSPPIVTHAVGDFGVGSLPLRPIITEPNPYRPLSQDQIVEIIEKIVEYVGNMFKSDKVISFDESVIKNKLMSIVGQGLAGSNPAES